MNWKPVSEEPTEPANPFVSYAGPFLVTDGSDYAIATFNLIAGSYVPQGWYIFGSRPFTRADLTHWCELPTLPAKSSTTAPVH